MLCLLLLPCNRPGVSYQHPSTSVRSDRHWARMTRVCCLCGLLRAMNWKMSWIATLSKKNKACVLIRVITCWCTAVHPLLASVLCNRQGSHSYTSFYRVCITFLPASITVRLTGMHQTISAVVSDLWFLPAQLMFSHSSIFLTWILKIKNERCCGADACSAGLKCSANINKK